ncbi:MAG: synthase [Candidatus Parcubacteria bacterium]|jgi:F-type H+-transporting ATPase subunit b
MSQILTILSSVGFNWHVALANFVNFLIILFILNKFFFGKLGKTITSRKEAIEKGLSQAADAEKALMSAEEEKKEIIHAAKKEGHVIVTEAQTQAKALASSITSEAEKEREERMRILKEKEADLQAKVEKDFAQQAPRIVANLYAQTLKKNLSEQDNNELIASMK